MDQTKKHHRSVIEFLEELKKDVQRRGETPEYPTNLKPLDDCIWGLHRKELMVVAARPSMGKTSFALQIAWSLASTSQVPVIFTSLEMSGSSILERIACLAYGFDSWKIRTGDEEQKKDFAIATGKEGTLTQILLSSIFDIYEDFGKNEAEITEILEFRKPKCLFIDHVQRISSKGFPSKQEALASYVQFLKSAAIKYDCAIVLNSQINRAGAGQDNASAFLKGTGELEEGADTILQCRWPCKEESGVDPNLYQVRVIKQRNGPTTEINLNFDPIHYRFSEYKPETYGE